MPIAQTITEICRENLDDGFRCGWTILLLSSTAPGCWMNLRTGHALVAEDIGEDDIENLLIQQLEFCNTIPLNKADMISEK